MRKYRGSLPVMAAVVAACLSSAIGAQAVSAQPPVAPVIPEAISDPSVLMAAPADGAKGIAIPALTPVWIEILAPISSRASKPGETFPIRLDKPIVIGGVPVVPAGTTGVGEVVHAKKSGGSGAGGELIVAARYLDVDGRKLRLRSMQVSITGKDQTDLAMATSMGVPFLGFAVKGKNTEIAAGVHAGAKVAEEFVVAPPAAKAPEPSEPQDASPVQKGEVK